MRHLLEPTYWLYILPSIIIALSVHEWSHAFMSYLLGDRTAKYDGRLSLNPIKHIDPLGFIMLIVVGFGWARPVMVDPSQLKNGHKSMPFVALAGPISNLVMAFLCIFPTILLQDSGRMIVHFLEVLVVININLAIFNLLPIPPLDGSNVILPYLPTKIYIWVLQNNRLMMGILILLLFTGFGMPMLSFLSSKVLNILYFAADGILGFLMSFGSHGYI